MVPHHSRIGTMLISEIYESKQGEGLLAGQPSLFLRTSGCNLRCQFCDTPFTSWQPSGKQLSIDQIVNEAVAATARHAVITGGEPMLPRQIVELTRRLKQHQFHITIETAGTCYRPVTCDLMSISPKLANSTPDLERAGPWKALHEQRRQNLPVVKRLVSEYAFQLKFVVAAPEDLAEIDQWLEQLGPFDRRRVLLMPEGTDADTLSRREEWLQPLSEQRGFTFCQRHHIFWYGHCRGT